MDVWGLSTTYAEKNYTNDGTNGDDTDRTLQNLCPKFEARTPYLVMFISSIVCIWLSCIIYVWNKRNQSGQRLYQMQQEDKLVEVIDLKSNDTPYYKLTEVTETSARQTSQRSVCLIAIGTFIIICNVFGFWYNLILDFKVLIENNGTWICYIAIFSSSPNFKYLISVLILSILHYKNYIWIKDQGDKLAICKLSTTIVLVLIPAVIFYIMPMIYIILGSVLMICGGGILYTRMCWKNNRSNSECQCDCSCLMESETCLVTFLMVFGSVCPIICLFACDLTLCKIHDIDDCTDWRLGFGEYVELSQDNIYNLLRFVSFFIFEMFH